MHVADAISIILASESFWKALALVLLTLFLWLAYKQVKKIRTELAQASAALVLDEKPLNLAHAIEMLESRTPAFSAIVAQLEEFNKAQAECRKCQIDCMKLQEMFRRDYLDGAKEDRAEMRKQLAILHDMVLQNRTILTEFTSNFGATITHAITSMVDMLKNKANK